MRTPNQIPKYKKLFKYIIITKSIPFYKGVRRNKTLKVNEEIGSFVGNIKVEFDLPIHQTVLSNDEISMGYAQLLNRFRK